MPPTHPRKAFLLTLQSRSGTTPERLCCLRKAPWGGPDGPKTKQRQEKKYAVPTEAMALFPLVPSRETPHPLLKSVKTRQMFPKALSAVRSRKRTEREQ